VAGSRLSRIDVPAPWCDEEITKLGEAVQSALVETMAVPERDRFRVDQHRSGKDGP
jgi:hypothetical protein